MGGGGPPWPPPTRVERGAIPPPPTFSGVSARDEPRDGGSALARAHDALCLSAARPRGHGGGHPLSRPADGLDEPARLRALPPQGRALHRPRQFRAHVERRGLLDLARPFLPVDRARRRLPVP